MKRQYGNGFIATAGVFALSLALGTSAEALGLGGGGGGSRGSDSGASSASSSSRSGGEGRGGVGVSVGGRDGISASVGGTRGGGLGFSASIGGDDGISANAAVGGRSGASLGNGIGVSVGGPNTVSVGGAATAKRGAAQNALTAVQIRALQNQARSPDVAIRVRAQKLLNANAALLSGTGNGSLVRADADVLDNSARARARLGTGDTDRVNVTAGNVADADVTLRSGRAAATAPAAEANIGLLSSSPIAGNVDAALGDAAAVSVSLGGGDEAGPGGATGPGASGPSSAARNAGSAPGTVQCGAVLARPAFYNGLTVMKCMQ